MLNAINNISLLTIAIPTYNRSSRLELLLNSIAAQFQDIQNQVQVIVVNNCSTDDTEQCCQKFVGRISGLKYIKNDENIGAVRNVIKCFELTETQYCWVIGDDDIVRIGSLKAILDILQNINPSLLYMKSKGFIDSPLREDKILTEAITPWNLDALNFGRMVHIYTTFISGMIVNKQKYLREKNSDGSMIVDTMFPQLNWVFANISLGGTFVYVPQSLILARGGSTGGYNLYKAFSIDLNRMINVSLPSDIGKSIKRRIILQYLPSLIIQSRKMLLGDFIISAGEWRLFREAYSGYLMYWVFVEPILHIPICLVRNFVRVSGLFARLQTLIDKIRVNIYLWAMTQIS